MFEHKAGAGATKDLQRSLHQIQMWHVGTVSSVSSEVTLLRSAAVLQICLGLQNTSKGSSPHSRIFLSRLVNT